MNSKYKTIVLKVLDKKQIKSTNEVLKNVKEMSGKTVNWYIIYHILIDLERGGKAEKFEASNIMFWRRKN